MRSALPGSITPAAFLKQHWHKQPLLVQELNHWLPEAAGL